MAWWLPGTKPQSEPMLTYCQLDPWKQTSVKIIIKIHIFSFKKMYLKVLSVKWWPFCLSLKVLTVRILWLSFICLRVYHSSPETQPWMASSIWIFNDAVNCLLFLTTLGLIWRYCHLLVVSFLTVIWHVFPLCKVTTNERRWLWSWPSIDRKQAQHYIMEITVNCDQFKEL